MTVRSPRILVLDRDDELAEQLRAAVDDLRPRPQVVPCVRIGSVGDVLVDDGPFDVIVAGPSLATRAGLTRLQIIREELPGMQLVLAFDRRPDTSLKEIVRAGAVELVQLPAEDKELGSSVGRALDVARQLTADMSARGALASSVSRDGPGRVFTIASATGGCGKTFFATNLAYFLSRYGSAETCIVDLDLQFGEVSTALRLRPRYTIYDALQREETDGGDLAEHIEEYTVLHETGTHVLAAPKDPAEADRITPPDVTRIVEAARTRYDYVVVDTPAALTEVVLAAFDLSDMLYVLATLDLPSVRNMSVFLSTLEKLKIPTEHVRLVMNKAESDVGIDLDQVTKLFTQGFETVLPYAKEVSRSINLGMPVMAASPTAEVSQKLTAGMKPLLPPEAQAKVDDLAPQRSQHGVLARLRRGRS